MTNELNIETVQRVELGDLTRFIAKAKGITYENAENLIPPYYYEGGGILYEGMNHEGDWYKEVLDEVLKQGYKSVEIYQSY